MQASISGLVKNKTLLKNVRHASSGFFITLMLFSAAEFAVLGFWQNRAVAAESSVPALNSQKPKKTPLEQGALGEPGINGQDPANDPASFKPEFKEEEIVSERDEFKSAQRNKDGTVTVTQGLDRVNFQKDGRWEKIDKTLVEDTNAADSGLLGSIVGQIESLFDDEPTTFRVKNNDWQA